LADRVGFLGPVVDVRSFWAQRHIALLLSDSEGFPNALLEAAFAGRPAIATDVGGTAEVVGPGGLLASPDDPEAIAAAIWQLIGDETRSAALGRAAWEHVSRTYTLDGMVGDHLLALEELVTAQGGRASARRERRGSLRTRLRGAKTTTSTDSCAR
jgi:glycosyltransferase involved in cell wall biosynthesis